MRLLCSFIRYIADGPERNETQQKCKGNLMLLLGFISFAAWDARREGSVRLFAAVESRGGPNRTHFRPKCAGGRPASEGYRGKRSRNKEEDL